MRRANILKILSNTSVVLGLGAISVFGGVAHAGTFQQRLQAELDTGKDYSAAWAAASRDVGPLYAPDGVADGNNARSALNRGQDYVAAWEAASRRSESVSAFSPEQVAKARKAKAEMNEGKDYIAAWEATTDEQPAARVQAASKGGAASGRERTRSTK